MAALAGAVAISFSGILYRVAHVSPTTGAVFRCLYAVVPLWLLARWEDRRYGPRPLRQRALAWAAGLFFAVDLVAWHQGIEEVGAGLATVLGNLQVVLVGLLAWVIMRERPSNRALAAIPVALVGVVLISGAFEHGAYGRNPGLGVAFGILTALSYSGFLLVLRAGNKDVRRPAGVRSRRRPSRVTCRPRDLRNRSARSCTGWIDEPSSSGRRRLSPRRARSRDSRAVSSRSSPQTKSHASSPSSSPVAACTGT